MFQHGLNCFGTPKRNAKAMAQAGPAGSEAGLSTARSDGAKSARSEVGSSGGELPKKEKGGWMSKEEVILKVATIFEIHYNF